MGGCRINDGWVRFQYILYLILLSLVAILLYSIIILSMEPRFHALIVCRIFDLFSPRSRY